MFPGSPGGHAEVVVARFFQLMKSRNELLQSQGLHVGMIDDVEAEVEEVLVPSCLRLEQGANVQLQLVEHLFVDIAVGVDEVAEQLILFDGLQMFFGHFDASGT